MYGNKRYYRAKTLAGTVISLEAAMQLERKLDRQLIKKKENLFGRVMQ